MSLTRIIARIRGAVSRNLKICSDYRWICFLALLTLLSLRQLSHLGAFPNHGFTRPGDPKLVAPHLWKSHNNGGTIKLENPRSSAVGVPQGKKDKGAVKSVPVATAYSDHTVSSISSLNLKATNQKATILSDEALKADSLSSFTNSEGGSLISIAMVVCEKRAPSALVALKSAVIMSQSRLHFHIFTDKVEIRKQMAQGMELWPAVTNGRVHYSMHGLTYPAGENAQAWRSLFKPCATVRLFLPDSLPDDSVLYIDTDVLFITPVELLWDLFTKFNSSQVVSMTPEHEAKEIGWYNRYGRHPYYGRTGLNSGVMLMNLTRLRLARFSAGDKKSLTWSAYIVWLYHHYAGKITWGDQDLLNIAFHFHPGSLYVHNCEWNYRPDHCMYATTNRCPAAEVNQTIHLLHGNRGAHHKAKWPVFKAVYQAYEAHPGVSAAGNASVLVQSVMVKIRQTPANSLCANAVPILAGVFRKLFPR